MKVLVGIRSGVWYGDCMIAVYTLGVLSPERVLLSLSLLISRSPAQSAARASAAARQPEPTIAAARAALLA